ncbi:MAG: YhgE/Pip domain-containing protein [Eubacterium ramulus]
MKNVWKIFQRDMMRVRNNVIALVVIIGISVVPCLYAWFNIAASWDPYSNTGNLKVAVASVDEGYEGSLIPIEINIGDKVLSALRENTQMEWVFTTEEKATSGVKSGKYYAAIVIPKDFSNKMMSVFSEKVEKPEITLLFQCQGKCDCTEGNR